MATLQRVSAESAIGEGLRCSLCGREPAEGSGMVTGADGCICDECVAACSDVLTGEEGARDSADAGDGEDGSGTDREPPRPIVFRLLTERAVAGLIAMDDVIEAMEVALRQFSTGAVVQPVRTVLAVGDGSQLFGVMPA